jgi:D-3-phosphoglycerate dehydrogenase
VPNNKIVFIDGYTSDGALEREVLTPRGYELVIGACKTDDDVVEVAGDAAGILNGLYWMGSELFARLPELKVVVRMGVGFDNIDIDAATEAGVVVCNVIDYGSDEVANHAFALLMALNRKLVILDRNVRQGIRGIPAQVMPHTGRFAGQTLGLVSFGTIARAVARRASGFDMRVLAFDPFIDPALAAGLGVELVSLPELMAQSDYISVHTPLSEATRGLIGAAELAMMKPSAYLVVTSRGGVVDEAALIEALRSGQIAGAGVDVFEKEPPDLDNPLLHFDNVVASMHMAWYSEVATVNLRRFFAESAADVLDGVMPRSVVNPKVLERVALRARPAEPSS